MGKVQRKPSISPKSTLPVESPGHTEFLQENVVTTHVKYSLPGKLIRDSISKVYIWGNIIS